MALMCLSKQLSALPGDKPPAQHTLFPQQLAAFVLPERRCRFVPAHVKASQHLHPDIIALDILALPSKAIK